MAALRRRNDALDLRPFRAGGRIRFDGHFHAVDDPFRRPLDALANGFGPIGSLADKLRVLGLRHDVLQGTVEELFARPERTTLETLRGRGFSDGIVERFFRPFLGGILLDLELNASSRMFEFVFRMLSLGDNALPAAGEVVATEQPAAARLLPGLLPVASRPATCVYFDAPRAPVESPVLVLDGDGRGPVTNLCVPSRIAPGYAPPGRALVSAVVVGEHAGDERALEFAVRRQLRGWFGEEVSEWRHLRTYRIAHAQPAQPIGSFDLATRAARRADGVYVAGDWLDTASLNGAIASGRRAAAAVLEDLSDSHDARPGSSTRHPYLLDHP